MPLLHSSELEPDCSGTADDAWKEAAEGATFAEATGSPFAAPLFLRISSNMEKSQYN